MIKLPKEVSRLMKAMEGAGFEAYGVGDCVRDSLMGEKPFAWDLVTNARLDELTQLFPDGKVIDEEREILRFEYIREVYDKDGEFQGEEGVIVDIGPYRSEDGSFCEKVEDDLARRDFTINAIADNPNKIADPFDGRGDIKGKLIRTVGPAEDRFKERPILMFRAVRLVSQLGFDLHKSVMDAIVKNYKLLHREDMAKVRREFTAMIGGPYAGKAMSMVIDTGLLDIILGEDIASDLNRREMSELTLFCKNIDKTKLVADRRLGVFYTALGKKKAEASIERLGFSGDTLQHLTDAVSDMAKLYFVGQKPKLKQFIYQRGWDRYNYMAMLEKAQRIVYEHHTDSKIKSRIYLLEEIKALHEPIFVEDMKISAEDLIEAGILAEGEDGKVLLSQMVEHLHLHPELNTRKELLKLAKKFKRNKIAALTRGVRWLR